MKVPVAEKRVKLFKKRTKGVDIQELDEEFNFAGIEDTDQKVESLHEEEEL